MVNDSKHSVFRFGEFELREREHTLLRAGEEIHLQPQIFRLLLYLVHNRGRVVQKDEILREVWDSAAVTDNSLTRSISWLRKVLDDDASEPRAIRTVSSIGYRFVCAVEETEDRFASCSLAEVAAEEPNQPESREIIENRYRTIRRFGGFWLLASVIAAAALLAAGLWYLRRPLPTPRVTAYTRLTQDGHDKFLAATDGSRLYFSQSSPNSINQVGIGGGPVVPIPVAIPGKQLYLQDISPDGSAALINTEQQNNPNYAQWIAPVLGGSPRRLPNGGGSFSPDGSSLIYSTLNGDIFLIRTDGTGNRKVANVPPVAFGASAIRFRWSPDRRTIRFSMGVDSRLWEMNSDGSGLHPLLPGWRRDAFQCCGDWTQDGSYFVFVAGGQIWALDARRGPLRRPSPSPIQLTSGPISWGPPVSGRDGKTIFATGATLKGELSRIDLKTGKPQPFLGGISAEYVSFSPDGKFVAYVSFPDGVLWKADRDGANRVQIAPGPDYNGIARWSPDSTEIAFGTVNPDGHFLIHRVSATDGTPLWLLPEGSGDTHDPNWSPDGSKILYCLGPPSSPTTARQDLRIVDLKNRQVKTLPGSEGKWSPRWSPDGRYIAALAGGTHPGGLLIFDFKTERWHTLPVDDDVEFPAFSSNSRSIYFLRHGHNQGVFRISVAGGKEERVADMADWHLTGFFGYSMSLDPTDAPLVLRDMNSNDIYALTLEAK